ncbi:branched-chain amino acid aminotransferase [bacterium]|nr:branched-chain amino acid aminotransferase [bacterium]
MGINWDSLTFSLTPTDTMFISTSDIDGNWSVGEYLPYGDIKISPAAGVLNYGQGLFEGLKAYRTKEGKITLFRPIENAKRMAAGARRLCMPEFPEEKFLEVMIEIIKRNIDYLPPYKKGSLYLRPCLWGTGARLGVAPAPEYTFIVYASPVGPYFKEGFKPIKLKITTDFHRAAPRGTGNVKAIGNYAGGMLPAKKAKSDGFSEVIYLDAKKDLYIEEVGAANFFCIKGDTLITPPTDSVLPGITRKSVMQIAKDVFGMEVIERAVHIDDALTADEVFATGTAAVISSIGLIEYQEKEYIYNNFTVGPKTEQLYNYITGIQLKEIEDKYGWIVDVDI